MDAIVIRGVTKKFRKRTINREYTTFKSELVNFLLRKQKKDRSWWIEVLKGIDLTVPMGKTVGIIGRNGSGKSTVLKLINGIYTPSEGTISVNGRISALLELGAGFHPDFSGRENITINGIILGMTRAQIRARMEEIIAFAELGEFIDEPVRTYSSGMYMRLAFAVATHVDPDILVIDEILAVGDEHFGKKSMAKMNEFKAQGKTIVLVTHDLGTVERWCDLAAWVDGGRIRDFGDPRTVVAHYRRVVAEDEAKQLIAEGGTPPPPPPQPRFGPAAQPGKRWGNFDLEFSSIQLGDATGAACAAFRPDESLRIDLAWDARTAPVPFTVHVALLRAQDGLEVWRAEHPVANADRTGRLGLTLGALPLSDGEWRLEIGARDAQGQILDCHRELHGFAVRGAAGGAGLLSLAHHWSADGDRRLSIAGTGS